nr:hypothetical protein Iba_scaffold810CG0020 [Ipomoea batatas]
MFFHNAKNNDTDNQQHVLPTRESGHVRPTDPYVFGVFENSINTTLTIYNNSGNLIKANCSCNTPLSQLGSLKKGSRRNSTNTLPLTNFLLVQSTSRIASQRCQYTPTNFMSGGLGTSTGVTKGVLSSKGFQETPSNLRSVCHLTSSVVTKVQSMPPISSQVLADTPTTLMDAINLTSRVNTTGQACRARSSQPFQVNTTNCHIPMQLRSQNLNTDLSNVESVEPPINTNVLTSSSVDINNSTNVIPPGSDGT